MNNKHVELFHRNKLNPILTAENWPYPINSVFNAGATLLPMEQLCFCAGLKIEAGYLIFVLPVPLNGIDGWQIDPQPTLLPDPDNFPEELWGIEDPRITFVKELKKYVIVFTAFTRMVPVLHWH